MFCPQCGSPNDDAHVFCKQCGASLRRGEATVPAPAPPVSAPPTAAPAAGQATRYANFGRRLLADIMDRILVSIVTNLIALELGVIDDITEIAADTGEVGIADIADTYLLATLLGVGISWLYEALMVSSSYQATLGKMAVGIVVTDMQGRRISFLRATGRHLGKYVSGMLLMIGYLIQPFTEKRQTLHDIMAGCLVLRKVPR